MLTIPESTWPTDVPYHREVALGWTSSALSRFHACPAAAYRRYVAGIYSEKDTDDQRLGDAVHRAALTPEDGMRLVEISKPKKSTPRRRQAQLDTAVAFGWAKEDKAVDFEAFVGLLDASGQRGELHRRAAGAFWTLAQHWPGLAEINRRHFAAHCPPAVAVAMAPTDSTRVAGQYLWAPHGRSEWTAYARDLDTGVPIKCRCDRILPGRSVPLILPDLKITIDARPRAFFQRVRDFGYVRQFAHYRRVLRAFWDDPGLEVDARWIVVQSRANAADRHPVIVYQCPADAIDAADEVVLADLRELSEMLSGDKPWAPRLLPGENWTDDGPETFDPNFFRLSSR